MTDISDDDLVGLSEFALLPENAEQAGVTGPLPTVRRVEADGISALQWGDAAPRVVFFHGGGQNAHTWDTVIVGLGVPALAVDLPGHGHSAWREDGNYSPQNNAAAVAPVLSDLAPDADLIVGMSLGGLTAIGLGAVAPHLVPRTRSRRRHPVGDEAGRRDDQRTAGHRRADAGRPGIPQLRRRCWS